MTNSTAQNKLQQALENLQPLLKSNFILGFIVLIVIVVAILFQQLILSVLFKSL
jgi:hypothetical protein